MPAAHIYAVSCFCIFISRFTWVNMGKCVLLYMCVLVPTFLHIDKQVHIHGSCVHPYIYTYIQPYLLKCIYSTGTWYPRICVCMLRSHSLLHVAVCFYTGLCSLLSYRKGGPGSDCKHVETNMYNIQRLLHIIGRKHVSAAEVRATRDALTCGLGQGWVQWSKTKCGNRCSVESRARSVLWWPVMTKETIGGRAWLLGSLDFVSASFAPAHWPCRQVRQNDFAPDPFSRTMRGSILGRGGVCAQFSHTLSVSPLWPHSVSSCHPRSFPSPWNALVQISGVSHSFICQENSDHVRAKHLLPFGQSLV